MFIVVFWENNLDDVENHIIAFVKLEKWKNLKQMDDANMFDVIFSFLLG